MTKEEIQEGNNLIALYMGAIYEEWEDEHCEEPSDKWYYYFLDDFGGYEIDELQYHSSWDWIIPVVQKINENELYKIELQKIVCVERKMGWGWNMITPKPFTIDGVYQAVIETIKLINNEHR